MEFFVVLSVLTFAYGIAEKREQIGQSEGHVQSDQWTPAYQPHTYHGGPLDGRPMPSVGSMPRQHPMAVDWNAGFQAGVEAARKMRQSHTYMPHFFAQSHPQTLAQRAARLHRLQEQAKIFRIRSRSRNAPEAAAGSYSGEDVEGPTSGMVHNPDGTWSWPEGSQQGDTESCCWQWAEDAAGNRFLNFVTEENKTKWYWSNPGHFKYSGPHRRRGTWMHLSPDDWESGKHNLNAMTAGAMPGAAGGAENQNANNYPTDNEGTGNDQGWENGIETEPAAGGGSSLAENAQMASRYPSKTALIVHKGFPIEMLKQIISDTMQIAQSSTLDERNVATFNAYQNTHESGSAFIQVSDQPENGAGSMSDLDASLKGLQDIASGMRASDATSGSLAEGHESVSSSVVGRDGDEMKPDDLDLALKRVQAATDNLQTFEDKIHPEAPPAAVEANFEALDADLGMASKSTSDSMIDMKPFPTSLMGA